MTINLLIKRLKKLYGNLFDNKIQIKGENQIKEILKGSWCCRADLGYVRHGKLEFFEDGTLTNSCYSNSIKWYWDVSDEYFYYQTETSTSVNANMINPKEHGRGCELYEIVKDEVYTIYLNDNYEENWTLILKGSKWEKRLEAYISANNKNY